MTGVDNGGHRTTKTVAYVVVGPPAISSSSPADGSSYLLGANVPVDYRCTSTVPQLNALRCSGPSAVDTTTVGSKTFTVDATDAAGVSSSRTSTYTVVWPFAGFDNPVSASGFVDKGGRADSVEQLATPTRAGREPAGS